jgi:hypothetical protein
VLDVPDATPVKPDGDVATACWRHRIDLPAPSHLPDGTRRVERRFGRWCGGRVSVEQLLGSTLYLACEGCGAPGVVVYELVTDEANWQTVTCRGCVPPSRATHIGATLRALSTRDASGLPWRGVDETWWPARQTRRP